MSSTYIVSFDIIIQRADDEVQAVTCAQEMLSTGAFSSYGVRNLDTGEYVVVDMTAGVPQVISLKGKVVDA